MKITNDNGEFVDAMAPIIISASRATDIPTFYSDWLVERWEKGHIRWKNPFNNAYSYVTFKNARVVVFWTKNPKPMMHKNLQYFIDKNINFYFQFTLNDYYKEGLELKVPEVNSRIETFQKLADQIGKEKVVWRFDPLILTNTIGVEELLLKIENIGNQLVNSTNKLVISFADIDIYKKVQNNLKNANIEYKEFDDVTMQQTAIGLQELNRKWNFKIATCAEKIYLTKYGITDNKCIDEELLINLFSHDAELMNFLGVKIVAADMYNPHGSIVKLKTDKQLKDKGQRDACGCIISKDIGQYNTCPHDCLYCYANTNLQTAHNNYKEHTLNPKADTITGK